jgi:hypothetical protein
MESSEEGENEDLKYTALSRRGVFREYWNLKKVQRITTEVLKTFKTCSIK